jgi:type I restriction enzyme M protein
LAKPSTPGCGTGGFLLKLRVHAGHAGTTSRRRAPQARTFFGREKRTDLPHRPANLILHGIDQPISAWQHPPGGEIYGGLFQDVPAQFSVVLTNPPFGGKEGKEAQTQFPYKTGATQVLFLQHVMDKLANGGRCGIVMDEGVLFRTNETAFVQVKRKLLNECNVWCIVSLPAGVFTAAGAGVKTNLVFFTKGEPTESIWYYDLSDVKVTKKNPLPASCWRISSACCLRPAASAADGTR